jgi:hypothetical protein
MKNVFNGYQNMIMNGTLKVVVQEWALDLNSSLENSNFRIVDSSIMSHHHCLETSFYVFITYVIFQQTINNVQRQSHKVIIKVNDEHEKQFPTQDVMNVLR